MAATPIAVNPTGGKDDGEGGEGGEADEAAGLIDSSVP
jgi:hypothetical protein